MATNRSMIAKSLVPGIRNFVGLSYGDTPQEHKSLFEVLNSDRAYEEEVFMSGMGGAEVKEEGGAVLFDDIREGYTSRYQHDTIAIAFAITKEAFDDDLYDNVARAKSQELGRSMADTKEVKAASVFNRGFDTNYVGGDGKPLFANDHPTSSGDGFNNLFNVDLSEAALEDIDIAISKITTDRGILMALRPKSLHIPVDLKYRAHKILKSDLTTMPMQNGTDNVSNANDVNALRDMGRFSGGVFVNHRFTDPDAFFIKTTATNGTKMFIREALSMDDDVDFNTDNMLYKFRERYSFGWTDPRQWVGATGT